MAEKEITLFQENGTKRKAHLFPDPFPEAWRVRLQADLAKEFGASAIDIEYAIRTCRDWSLGSGKKRVNWLAVIRNGVRKGWLRPSPGSLRGQPSRAVKGALARLNQRSLGGPREH